MRDDLLRAFIAGGNVGKGGKQFLHLPPRLHSGLPVRPPYGLLIRAQRVRLFPLTRRWESSCKNRVCISRVFCCWVQAFPHAQTVEVNFPMREPCSLFSFWDGCLPYVLLAVVSNFVLDHCVFVVSRFLLGSAFEFPWLCWERYLLTSVGCDWFPSLIVSLGC